MPVWCGCAECLVIGPVKCFDAVTRRTSATLCVCCISPPDNTPEGMSRVLRFVYHSIMIADLSCMSPGFGNPCTGTWLDYALMSSLHCTPCNIPQPGSWGGVGGNKNETVEKQLQLTFGAVEAPMATEVPSRNQVPHFTWLKYGCVRMIVKYDCVLMISFADINNIIRYDQPACHTPTSKTFE